MSTRTALTPSKAHRYLASLARTELVVQNPLSGLYDLGPLALRLGFAAQNRVEALKRSLTAASRLAQQSGHTSMVTSWSDRGPVIIRWVQGAKPVYTTLSLGAVLSLTRSATGRVYLAYLPARLTKPLLQHELPGTFSKDIDRWCRETRASGVACVRGNLIPGLAAMAAPIFDGQGQLASVLTILGTVEAGLSPRAQVILQRVARGVSNELAAA